MAELRNEWVCPNCQKTFAVRADLEPVLCPQCEAIVADSSLVDRYRLHAPDLMRVLAVHFCTRCRAMLHSVDEEKAMRTKLSQMSRFGLGADDRPLLTQEPPAE